jgi:hypothetical protein
MIQLRFFLFVLFIAVSLGFFYWLFSWGFEYIKFRIVLWRNKKEEQVKKTENDILKKNKVSSKRS